MHVEPLQDPPMALVQKLLSISTPITAPAESKVSPTPPSIASNGIRTSRLFNVDSENDQYKVVLVIYNVSIQILRKSN